MQETLERAIETITSESVRIRAAGRTDAGAHALAQVAVFPTSCQLPAADIRRALNATLPRDIAVTTVVDVPESFHPRFDAYSRVYRYRIWNRLVRSPFYEGRAAHVRTRLDVPAMQAAARHLIGHHDLGAFVPVQFDADRNRSVFRAECSRDDDLVTVELEASGFMKQMVRAIVGTLIAVGTGKIDAATFRTILESRDRTQAGVTAPAQGLYLTEVRYASTPYTPGKASDVPAPRAADSGAREE